MEKYGCKRKSKKKGIVWGGSTVFIETMDEVSKMAKEMRIMDIRRHLEGRGSGVMR